MKPKIDSTNFGSITVDGKTFDYDILIRLNGQVEKNRSLVYRHLCCADTLRFFWRPADTQINPGKRTFYSP
jgi:hypothetical protein